MILMTFLKQSGLEGLDKKKIDELLKLLEKVYKKGFEEGKKETK